MSRTVSGPDGRRRLPLLATGRHGPRSNLTCEHRCGNACDRPPPNPTDHPHVSDAVAQLLERRSLLQGGAAAGGALVLGGVAAETASSATAAAGVAVRPPGLSEARFVPVPPNVRDAVVVPRGFRSQVVVRWGDRVVPGTPAFDVTALTPRAARGQFGYNNDYVGLVRLPRRRFWRRQRALLVVNHEYTDAHLMFPAGAYDDRTRKRIEMAYHGMSVVEVERGRKPGSWRRVPPRQTRFNRRLHDGTAFALDGPAAGHERVRTGADPTGTRVLGTLNNCSGGVTPWGTVLSGEENFDQYFDATGPLDDRYAESYARYGINGGTRGWSDVAPRFDLTREPHEPFRFGWIVEVDPLEPRSTPVKHTMLGRFKHEGANIAVAPDGRVVAYMGDDERGEYLYRFVSRDRMVSGTTRAARAANKRLLSAGTLSVARLTGDGREDGDHDGSGAWLPLCSDTESFVDGMTVAEVLLDTRLAADKVAPTRMDRPEDVQANPVNGRVYAALTNNVRRGRDYPVDEANPLASSMVRSSLGAPLRRASGNRNGYVLELVPVGAHTSPGFRWDLLLVCGDPEAPETRFGRADRSRVSPISCPDNVAFDRAGNLWISTDGNALGSNDGVFRVPVAGPRRGMVQQFLTVPRGAEACGPFITGDDRSLFVAVQHPGEVDGATFARPASTWPHPGRFPRPAVVVAFRDR